MDNDPVEKSSSKIHIGVIGGEPRNHETIREFLDKALDKIKETSNNEKIAMNTTTSILIDKSCCLSSIFFMNLPLRKSIVSVEDDAITSDDNVDIDADNTSITTSAISPGERF